MDIIQHSETRRDISPIFLFALTLFSSATLMFVLQPMFGKALLPFFGGSASVWNTCMVFYQSMLFLGYLYAHMLSSYFCGRKQFLIHAAFIIISLSFLPVGLQENSSPPTDENPTLWLLTTLLLSIGLPFFILSTVSPLLQKWFSSIGHQTSSDPYYLSIASNTGSLIALLSYPFVIEPELGLSLQQQWWSIGFLSLCGLIVLCMLLYKYQSNQDSPVTTVNRLESNRPAFRLKLQWVLLSFVPSSLLLGTTNYISIDIASVPLLWVVPLSLYLASFIIVFSSYSIKIHKKMFLIQPWVITPFLIYYFSQFKLLYFTLELSAHLLAFFISIMVCHGELAKKRPSVQYLTQYYLLISFGGMLGGMFNNFVAPFVFNSIYEYPLMIVIALSLNPIHKRIRLYLKEYRAKIIFSTYILAFIVIFYLKFEQFNYSDIGLAIALVTIAHYYFFNKNPLYIPLFGLVIVSCTSTETLTGDKLLHQSRSFYGVLSVKKNTAVKVDNRLETLNEIYSGTTEHGAQITSDYNAQCNPIGYYSTYGPLGQLFTDYNEVNDNWNIGVVGLGAGGMSGYFKETQNWTFFELNPAVVDVARNTNFFTFLSKCIHHYDLKVGDARLTLETGHQQHYDLLVIDAFTSDSIPTHLLTKEAVMMYFSKLKKDGLLVFHISNRYLDLTKVLSKHAEQLGLIVLSQEYRPKDKNVLVHKSDWAVLARNSEALKPLLNEQDQRWHKLAVYPDIREWTDDYTSIVSVWK